MITIGRIGNVLIFKSEKHQVALGYLVLSFRKRVVSTKLGTIRESYLRAARLERALPAISPEYTALLWECKRAVYSPRYDLTRSLDSVIHPIVEISSSPRTLGDSWDLIMRGQGTSVFTGKPIKSVTCMEKEIKILKLFVDRLSDSKDLHR